MARRRVAYRKRNQNRFSMFLVALVVVMVTAVVAVRSVELKQKLEAKLEEQKRLKEQIADIAREKLGLVYEGEILFKRDD